MSAPVRVLWLTKGLGRGGAEQLLLNLARAIDPSRVQLEVGYVLPHKGALASDLARAGVGVHLLGDHPTRRWPLRLRSLLRGDRYDVVHTHSPLVASVTRVLAARGTALVHTEHNVWGRYRRPTRWAHAATIGRNRKVWAVSAGVADTIRPPRWLGPPPPIHVLIHGIDQAAFAEGPEAPQRGLDLLALPPGPFTIGSVGNLTTKKDQDTLIRALVVLRRTVPDARLVLVGTGPRERHLRDLVAELGLSGAVVLAGTRDDVADLLPAFDAFALSSRHEGLSIALLEAMAAGVPPVVTAVGGIPEVVSDGRDGLLVPPGNPQALAGACARLATEPGLREVLGTAARERAGHFGIAPAAQTLVGEYESLCRSHDEALAP